MAIAHELHPRGTPPSSPAEAKSPKRRRVDASPRSALQSTAEFGENGCLEASKSEVENITVLGEHEQVENGGVTCGECGLRLLNAAELMRHGRETKHRPFVCRFQGCDKSYSKQEHLTRHVETAHKRGSALTIEQRKPFKCEVCQARFTYKHALTRHEKRSHKNANAPFECAECLLAFKKKTDLQAHTYVHTGVLPFQCEDCGERYLKKYLLTRHQRSHMGKDSDNQVLVCECGEFFFSNKELVGHKQTAHMKAEKVEGNSEALKTEQVIEVPGAKQNIAEPQAASAEEDNAVVYIKSDDSADDTKVKQYSSPSLFCQVCQKTFHRKQNLRSHLRTHFKSLNERKEYVCPMPGCSKAYTRASNLMTHYNGEHDERKSRRFACPREGCTARFGYKTVLLNHIEKIHDHPVSPKKRERSSMGVLARALGMAEGSNGVAVAMTFEGGEDVPQTEDKPAPTSRMPETEEKPVAPASTTGRIN